MAIGERIRYFRNKFGLTQKALGQKVGFPERYADIRMNQYENGSRNPKADMVEQLAYIFDVSPEALKVPNIDTYFGLAHTLFAMEDIYGLTIDETETGEICLKVNLYHEYDKNGGYHLNALDLHKILCAWKKQAARLRAGEITKEEYDYWRYTYPKMDAVRISCKEK